MDLVGIACQWGALGAGRWRVLGWSLDQSLTRNELQDDF